MPSPIGHTLLAFSVTGFQNKSSLSMAGWYLLILIAGVAPDFDFLPGILIGDPNRFHHGPTHSILAGIVFTAFMYLIIRPLNLRAAILIFLVYLTHVLADSLSADSGAPYGVPLFWPFSPDYLISPIPVFDNFIHGGAGGGFDHFLGDVFSIHNLWAIAIEILVLGPILWISHRLRQRKV